MPCSSSPSIAACLLDQAQLGTHLASQRCCRRNPQNLAALETQFQPGRSSEHQLTTNSRPQSARQFAHRNQQ
eukprot:8549026-Pyramimonas_sp.AAC.1